MNKICTFLVGVPGAGKSTWLKNADTSSAYIASTDDIIQTTAADYGLTYDEAFKDLINFAERAMWHNLLMAAEDGDPIYIDRTNLSVKSRKRFIDVLKPCGYVFNAVVFPIPEQEEWTRRLNSRPGKTIPDNIIRNMARSFVMPTASEGISSVIVV